MNQMLAPTIYGAVSEIRKRQEIRLALQFCAVSGFALCKLASSYKSIHIYEWAYQISCGLLLLNYYICYGKICFSGKSDFPATYTLTVVGYILTPFLCF